MLISIAYIEHKSAMTDVGRSLRNTQTKHQKAYLIILRSVRYTKKEDLQK